MKESDVLVKINGKVHRLNKDNPKSIKTIAWKDRKQLIELLETIKQAEYINADNRYEPETDEKSEQPQEVESKSISGINVVDQPTVRQRIGQVKDAPKLDPKVKASDKDVDDLMARLILEQKQENSHQPVPDKSAVIKLLLIVFVVIVVLAVIF